MSLAIAMVGISLVSIVLVRPYVGMENRRRMKSAMMAIPKAMMGVRISANYKPPVITTVHAMDGPSLMLMAHARPSAVMESSKEQNNAMMETQSTTMDAILCAKFRFRVIKAARVMDGCYLL